MHIFIYSPNNIYSSCIDLFGRRSIFVRIQCSFVRVQGSIHIHMFIYSHIHIYTYSYIHVHIFTDLLGLRGVCWSQRECVRFFLTDTKTIQKHIACVCTYAIALFLSLSLHCSDPLSLTLLSDLLGQREVYWQ